MALTHVCRWSKEQKKWVPVSLYEAIRMFPNQTVSANTGLFMCDLCKQYVILTNGKVYGRYFKHNSGDANKVCEERSTGPAVTVYLNPSEHNLPIRMFFSDDQFHFEIGFYSVPKELLSGDKGTIEITSSTRPFTYSFERLHDSGITYLSVGAGISAAYDIRVNSYRKRDYSRYWPSQVSGVSDGSMFDADTHKKLAEDADVTVQHHYFLLTRYSCPAAGYAHVKAIKRAEIAVGWSSWKVFDVYAETYDADAARFFFEHSCRLTETPTQMYPIWPPVACSPYFVHHYSNNIFLYVQGDGIGIWTSPTQDTSRDGNLLTIHQGDRDVLVSAGRLKVIRYLFLSKEKIKLIHKKINYQITDSDDNSIDAGIYQTLPKEGYISIKLEFDGFIKCYRNNKLFRKERIPAKSKMKFDGITYGIKLKVYIGLDCIWESSWERKKAGDLEEQELLIKLKKSHGDEIPVSHEIAYIYRNLDNYPAIKHWVASRQRVGSIAEDAFRLLWTLVIDEEGNGVQNG